MPAGRVAGSQAERVKASMRLLVRELLAIAEQSNFTEERLIELERILNTLGTGQFVPNLSKVATAINQISGALAETASPNRVNEINNLRTALFMLAQDMERSAVVQTQLRQIRGLPPAERTKAGMLLRHEETIKAQYIERAAMSFEPQELAGKSAATLRDEIGARATSLRLQDAMKLKLEEIVDEERTRYEIALRLQDVMKNELRELVNLERDRYDELKKVDDALADILQKEKATKDAKQQTKYADSLGGRIKSGTEIGSMVGGQLEIPDKQSIGEILQEYERFIGTSTGVENLRVRMEALGITNARVTSATHELSSGVKTFGFAIEKDGVKGVERATIRLDQYGNVLRDVGTRYQNWTTAIGNNLTKVVRWGIATGVVYGSMKVLKQVLTEIIDIENELANVQIALGKGAGNLNDVFKEAIEVANLTSSSVKGVIEGYTLAYQAAGSFEDPSMRAAAANSLLLESMTLATLAGTDQAQAMDTLVGALRQTGQELTEGRELLDRWVAVSRESNVSMNTLAQTYAIVGATAQGLGLTFEQLNALTATLAEATGLSATETGNAIRGIVAGFQTVQAEKVLDRFGVETRKATGELRNFWDLLNEVSDLLSAGAISPAELTEIANAIGGGYRRGAQVQTILEGMARAQQLVAVQMHASGQAAEAMETKIATLQAAINRLGNAFTNIAQSLGQEGGFLWVAKETVEVLTFFVNILDRIVGGLGKATPALLTFGAAWFALQGGLGQKILGKQAGGLLTAAASAAVPGSNLIRDRLGDDYDFPDASYTRGDAFGKIRSGVQQRGMARGIPSGLADPASLIGILGPALATVIQTAATDKSGAEKIEGYQKAGIQMAGGIAGALIGGPTGAILGSAIGGAFADAVIDDERNIAQRLAEIFIESAKMTSGEDIIEEDIPAGQQLDKIADELPQNIQNLADVLAAWVVTREFVAPERGTGHFESPENVTESTDILLAAIHLKLGEDLPKDLAERLHDTDLGLIEAQIVPKIEEADIEGAADLINKIFGETISEKNISGAFSKAVEAGIPGMETASKGLVNAFMEEAQRQFILGDMDIASFMGLSEMSPETIAPFLSQMKKALSLSGVKMTDNELIDFYLDLDDASKQLLDTASKQVVARGDLLSYYQDEARGAEEIAEKTENYNDSLRNLANLQEVIAQRQILAGVEERPIVDLGGLTQEQIQAVKTEADRVRDQQAMAFADGSEEGMELWVEHLGDVLITTGSEGGKIFWGEFFDQDPAFIKAALENLGLEDALKEITQFGLRDLRDQMGVSDFPSLMRRYEQIKSSITTTFPDYDVQDDATGLIFKDGMREFHGDMTILNLAMQDLIDVNEQQLEGIWNLPAGMTAFIPWSSLYSRDAPSGGSTPFPFEMGEDATEPVILAGGRATPPPVELAGGRATPPPVGRVFTDADVTPELQALKDTVDRLDALVELGAREAGVGVQDYAALKDEADAARGEYMDAFYQAVKEVNMGTDITGAGGLTTQEPVTIESIVQSFQEAFQLENTIELNASIRLIVDGRTLANVVKQYLFTDLVQAVDRSMGGGSGYVIEAE